MTGIVLIAAGESSRLGRPKQLLPWAGHTLLRHAALTALDAGLGPVAVVIGAYEVACRAALDGLSLKVCHNPDWLAGMAGSIIHGVRSLPRESLKAVIIMLCDQPFITAATLRRLDTEWQRGGCEIVATRDEEIVGPPVLFSSSRFDDLLALAGQQGARFLLRDSAALRYIDCPRAAIDVDTPADWEAARQLDQPG